MMVIKMNGVHVMYRAIESFRYENGCLVVRTVSGNEHKKENLTEAEAEKVIDIVTARMAIAESV